MKKILASTILFTMLSFLGSCGAEKPQDNNEVTDVSIELPNPGLQEGVATGESNTSETDTQLENKEFQVGELTLKTIDWTELDCYADEDLSLLNSNLLLNYGNLAYDGNGHIYFVDMNTGDIYVSDWNGENKKLFSENPLDKEKFSGYYGVSRLQVVGDWLYFNGPTSDGVKRIHRETGEVERIREEPCGEAIVLGDKLYTNGPEGISVAELDGTEKKVIRDQNLQMISQQVSENNLWLGQSYKEDNDLTHLSYLLGYNEIQDEWSIVLEEDTYYTLLAGNWISAMSDTATRHVWDLERDIEIDLGIYDNSSVSDGTTLYCSRDYSTCSIFYQWDGEEVEELFRVDIAEEIDEYIIENKYLTPEALYWMQKLYIDGKETWELWYYDLETGEKGRIH